MCCTSCSSYTLWTEYCIFTVVAADSFEEIQGIHHKVRLKVRKGIYNVKGSIKLKQIGLEVVSIIFSYLWDSKSANWPTTRINILLNNLLGKLFPV